MLLSSGRKAFCDLRADFAEHCGSIKLFHFRNAGKASRKRLRAHPIRACVSNGRSRCFHMIAAANSRHIIAVCKSFTEANKICFNSVIMIRTCKIKSEACAHIVKDKHHSVLVAEFTNCLPIILGGTFIILKVAVIIRLSNKAGNIAAACVISLLKCIKIKPRHNNIVCNLFGKNTWIVYLLRPLEIAVIISFKEKHFLFSGVSTGAHNGKRGGIRAVFHKESPISAGNGVLKQFCTFNHFV